MVIEKISPCVCLQKILQSIVQQFFNPYASIHFLYNLYLLGDRFSVISLLLPFSTFFRSYTVFRSLYDTKRNMIGRDCFFLPRVFRTAVSFRLPSRWHRWMSSVVTFAMPRSVFRTCISFFSTSSPSSSSTPCRVCSVRTFNSYYCEAL